MSIYKLVMRLFSAFCWGMALNENVKQFVFDLTCDVTGDPGVKYFNFIWKISSRALYCRLIFSAMSISYRDRWGVLRPPPPPQQRAGVGLGPAGRGLTSYESVQLSHVRWGEIPSGEDRTRAIKVDPLLFRADSTNTIEIRFVLARGDCETCRRWLHGQWSPLSSRLGHLPVAISGRPVTSSELHCKPWLLGSPRSPLSGCLYRDVTWALGDRIPLPHSNTVEYGWTLRGPSALSTHETYEISAS